MENRVPTKPGRIKLTDDSGNVKYYFMERADEPTTEGTPLNKATLFAVENEARYACSVPSEALTLLTREWQVNVFAVNWSAAKNSDGYYTQTVTVADMREVFCPKFMPLDDTFVGNFSKIDRMITSDGSVTFLATQKPLEDISVRIVGV